ncbi:MAG: class I SAM-dependent methyltransferase, partial [Phycisphaerae bacterium]|nr:class I SAM-dependent methyltransferase [Phycisphaerae bacterium]
NCGLVFQSPKPDFDELRRYYKGYITETQPDLVDIPISFEEHVLSVAKLRLKFLSPHLRKGDRVLDIGCSFGAMLKVLKDESERELNLVGVNPEPGVAEFGIRNYGLDIRVGMFEDIDFDAESFNLVILDNVIEHFADPRRSVRSIRKLLAPDGRFFIATNNLDEPHGFLWQNFFPDHTVTFSTGTLRALLESEGFTILAHDTSGHVTYAGYHYPYQLCIAAKAEAPDAYDFHKRGDSAEAKLVQAREYIKSTYRENGLAKRVYEKKLQSSAGPVARLKAKAIELLASVSGRATDFQIQNHTLPTEEYFYRRVLLAECATDEDVALAFRTIRESGTNPEVIILRPAGKEQFMIQCCPQSPSDRQRPAKPAPRKAIWRWALQNYPHVDEGISLQFNNADVREDVLLRLYKAFRNRKSDHCVADFGFFTSARFEFLKRESLEKLGADREGEEEDFLVPVT